MKGRFYDITMTIGNEMVSWPGDGSVRIERVRSMDAGERLNLSRMDMSVHTGTHIDAPVHFLRDGSGVDALPLDRLMGPALVVSLPGTRVIGAAELASAGIPADTERLLLKTDNGDLLGQGKFNREYCHLAPDGAAFLLERGIGLVGIDYLSIAEYGSGEEVHRALLGEGVVIVEGVDLREVPPGLYRMTALPLKIRGCDGAPARVVLEEATPQSEGPGR